MKFTLFYSGKIRSSNKKNSKHIDEIRCSISPQIRKLYNLEPLKTADFKCEPGEHTKKDVKTYLEIAGQSYSCLVDEKNGLACKIVVTFFESSGSLSIAKDIGDIDNKAKTLVDALKIPSGDEVKKLYKNVSKQAIHCLLMDDSFLWGVDLNRRRLLNPQLCEKETFTQIDVEIIPRIVTLWNSSLFGVPVF